MILREVTGPFLIYFQLPESEKRQPQQSGMPEFEQRVHPHNEDMIFCAAVHLRDCTSKKGLKMQIEYPRDSRIFWNSINSVSAQARNERGIPGNVFFKNARCWIYQANDGHWYSLFSWCNGKIIKDGQFPVEEFRQKANIGHIHGNRFPALCNEVRSENINLSTDGYKPRTKVFTAQEREGIPFYQQQDVKSRLEEIQAPERILAVIYF